MRFRLLDGRQEVGVSRGRLLLDCFLFGGFDRFLLGFLGQFLAGGLLQCLDELLLVLEGADLPAPRCRLRGRQVWCFFLVAMRALPEIFELKLLPLEKS